MSQAKLTQDLLLLYGYDSEELLSDTDSLSDGMVGGNEKFFDDVVDGGLDFDSDFDSDNSYMSVLSEDVDIFSDNEDMKNIMGGYQVIKKDIDDNRDTYEESELSEKTMYMGNGEVDDIYKESSEENIYAGDDESSEDENDSNDDTDGNDGILSDFEEYEDAIEGGNPIDRYKINIDNFVKNLPVI